MYRVRDFFVQACPQTDLEGGPFPTTADWCFPPAGGRGQRAGLKHRLEILEPLHDPGRENPLTTVGDRELGLWNKRQCSAHCRVVNKSLHISGFVSLAIKWKYKSRLK